MMQYFFILGRNPDLSAAEIIAVLPNRHTICARSREVLIAECGEIQADQIMKRLGGSVKMGLVCHGPARARPAVNDILNIINGGEKGQKLLIGLSAYRIDENVRLPSERELRDFGMKIKRALREKGFKVRLVTSKERVLSAVIVKKEKLIAGGTEAVLLYTASGVYSGRTLAVQEFEEAGMRDFGRPRRQMNVGMLPVQLAKILINLARVPLDAKLLDPFCGFGTVLSEALAMGYRNLVGSDINENMISATRENLEWMREKFKIPPVGLSISLFTAPAEKISDNPRSRGIDAIITEPYLGSVRGGFKNREQELPALERLYISAFREFAKIMKTHGRIVFIFPAFKNEKGTVKVSARVLSQIQKFGFTPINILPSVASGSMLYSRSGQRVLREIFVFEYRGLGPNALA